MKQQDSKQYHIQKLGNEFGKLFHEVYSEWVWACVRHEEIEALFGTQEKCDILNTVDPRFFGDVQRLFWNDLMLRVARLADKRRDAVRVQSIERFIRDDPVFLRTVRQHRENAVAAAQPVIDWRNRVIAHRNREYATNKHARPLETVEQETCEQALNHVHSALNAVYRARMESSLSRISHLPTSLPTYLEWLVNSVRFVAEIINPEDPDGLELSEGREFLAKMGRYERGDDERLFELMRIARHVSKKRAQRKT